MNMLNSIHGNPTFRAVLKGIGFGFLILLALWAESWFLYLLPWPGGKP